MTTLTISETLSLQRFGFHIFVEHNSDDSPTGFLARTVGLLQTYGHPEIEIVHEVDQPHKIIHAAIALIRKGVVFQDNESYKEILANNYCARAVRYDRDNTSVIRLILPDPSNNTEAASMSAGLSMQYIPSNNLRDRH